MKQTFISIVIFFCLFFIGCKKDVSMSLIDRAELILNTNPDSSRLLLDSIAITDNLNDDDLARWCMFSGKIADTLFTDLPYPTQLERAQKYYLSHGTPVQQAQITLYLGRAYVNDKEYDKVMHTYLWPRI